MDPESEDDMIDEQSESLGDPTQLFTSTNLLRKSTAEPANTGSFPDN